MREGKSGSGGQIDYGFVSAMPAAPPEAAAVGVAFPNFGYQGGPVVVNPQIYLSFWGALWSDQAHQQRAAQLAQFISDLLQSPFMNVLSQYGVGQGAGMAGAYISSSFIANVPAALTDSDVRSTIQANIDAGDLPEPASSNQVLIIFLDENTGINDPAGGLVLCEPQGDTAFGYHQFFSTNAGNAFYYGVIPALDDNCINNSCPGGPAGCSINVNETQLDRVTQVTTHEFAEMATDPQLNAWLDSNAGEIGDICNGRTASITVGANTWNVQAIYSVTDDQNSAGASYCASQEPNPLPSLI